MCIAQQTYQTILPPFLANSNSGIGVQRHTPDPSAHAQLFNFLHCGVSGTNLAFGKRIIRLTLGGSETLVSMVDQNC